MSNLKKISKKAGINPLGFHQIISLKAEFLKDSLKAGFLILLALWCSCALVLPVLAVSAENGNFIILGKAMNKDEQGKVVYEDEFVALWAQPGASDIKLGKAESGTQARVLDKTKVGPGNFYFIKTVGGEIVLMGWVSEDNIYQITDAPQGE